MPRFRRCVPTTDTVGASLDLVNLAPLALVLSCLAFCRLAAYRLTESANRLIGQALSRSFHLLLTPPGPWVQPDRNNIFQWKKW